MKQTLEMKNKEKSNQIQCLDQNKTETFWIMLKEYDAKNTHSRARTHTHTHTHTHTYTHEGITPRCSPRTSLSGYTLNKDGAHLVTHANIVTPHTAQNKTKK